MLFSGKPLLLSGTGTSICTRTSARCGAACSFSSCWPQETTGRSFHRSVILRCRILAWCLYPGGYILNDHTPIDPIINYSCSADCPRPVRILLVDKCTVPLTIFAFRCILYVYKLLKCPSFLQNCNLNATINCWTKIFEKCLMDWIVPRISRNHDVSWTWWNVSNNWN